MDMEDVCPNCGSIMDDESDFCNQCGYDLINNVVPAKINNSEGFFDKLSQKTNIPSLIFSFIIFGFFLFFGSVVWSSFLSRGSIGFSTYLLLTIIFAVFFASCFLGYFLCKDKSYVIPNFLSYIGSIYAVVLTVFGFLFMFGYGILSSLSSIIPFGSSSPYSSTLQASTSNTSFIDVSSFFEIILFILLIPVVSYIGVYLGYYLNENI